MLQPHLPEQLSIRGEMQHVPALQPEVDAVVVVVRLALAQHVNLLVRVGVAPEAVMVLTSTEFAAATTPLLQGNSSARSRATRPAELRARTSGAWLGPRPTRVAATRVR